MNKMAMQVLNEAEIIAEEDLVIDVQFLLQEMINKHSVSRSELAKKIGITRARLTQLMQPNANPTIRTLARIFNALGERIEIGVKSAKKNRICSLNQLEWSTTMAANDFSLSERSLPPSRFVAPTFDLEWDEQTDEFGPDYTCPVELAIVEAAAA